MAETKARHIANLVEDDGDVKSAHLDNITVTPTAVSDQANTSTGYLDVPSGTEAQRPGSPSSGNLRFNTDVGSLEVHSGATWVSTNEPTPTITSISGTIYAGVSGRSLTITGTDFNTSNISVEYLDGATRIEIENNLTPSSSTSITRTIPASVYGKASGTTIGIRVLNAGSVSSNINTSKTVIALPSGGTVDDTSVSGYRIHTFTTSDATGFTNTIANLSVEYLVIGGGGSGGGGYYNGGGGGAGGYRTNVSGQSSGGGASAESAMTLSVTNYPVVIGAGDATRSEGSTPAQAPTPFTSFNGITSQGGGGGGKHNTNQAGVAGGSGGGASQANSTKGDDSGAGTANQGYAGGAGWYAAGAGGGGAGQRGALGTNYTGPYSGGTTGVKGGDGVSSNITGTATTRAGGGGGGGRNGFGVPAGVGGSGGGGDGGVTTGGNGNNGDINTGSGGGGAGGNDASVNRSSGAGGSGIVIIRYQLPA